MDILVSALQTVLIGLFQLTNSYGVSILMLTGGVRLALLPLAIWQQRTSRASAALQAEIKQVQERYKGAEAESRMRDLYSRSGHQMLLGCLPSLAQWPAFLAMYGALTAFPFTIPAGFAWIQHLAMPDPYFILPAASVLLSMGQVWLTSPREQRLPMLILPVLMGFWMAKASAAIALYWVASNLFGLVQHVWLARRPVAA